MATAQNRKTPAAVFRRLLARAQRNDLDRRRDAAMQELQRIATRLADLHGRLLGYAQEYRALGDNAEADDCEALAQVVLERSSGLITLNSEQ